MGIALDAGADDLKRAGSTFEITCDPAAFNQVQEALEKNDLTPSMAEISQVPKVPVDVDAETGQQGAASDGSARRPRRRAERLLQRQHDRRAGGRGEQRISQRG